MNNLPPEIKLIYILAIGIMLLFVAFIIFVVMMYNKRQLLYRKEKQLQEANYQNELLQEELKRQKAVQQERERISHDMHDELGAGISALKLQVEFLKMNTKDETKKADIDELLQTAESMNLSMREMLWSLNAKNDNLGNFTHYLSNYAENFFRKTNFDIQSKIVEIDSEQTIPSEIRRNLLLCLKEALNNIYKHSNGNQVDLILTGTKSGIQMYIKDNGNSFKPDSIKGNGLHNMRVRMENVNGSFQMDTENGGLQLMFSVPLTPNLDQANRSK